MRGVESCDQNLWQFTLQPKQEALERQVRYQAWAIKSIWKIEPNSWGAAT